MNNETRFFRHDLLFLSENGKRGIENPIRDYMEKYPGIPLIRAREDETLLKGYLQAGLSLPEKKDGNRIRFLLQIHQNEVIKRISPWDTAEEMCENGEGAVPDFLRMIRKYDGIKAGIYGSQALQWHTGYDYKTEQSDLDLIFTCQSMSMIKSLKHVLAEAEHMVQSPIDAEVRVANYYDIKLHELCGENTLVLAKSVNGAELLDNSYLEMIFRH